MDLQTRHTKLDPNTKQYFPVRFTLPKGYDPKTTYAVYAGEKRFPKKGELYLSGSVIEAYRAVNDLSMTFPIAKLVQAKVVTVVEELPEPPPPAFERGDVIMVMEEWETDPRKLVILSVRNDDTVVTVDHDVIDTSIIKHKIGHLDEEQLFSVRKVHLLRNIPEELHSPMIRLAWESGHSAGYDEVINTLSEMVDYFQKPCEDLIKRVSGK